MGYFDLFSGKKENKPAFSEAKPGDILRFGRYPFGQDGSIGPIEWIVLGISTHDLLLISRYCLDTMGFCGQQWQNAAPLWETSYIRNWLNRDFYHAAFREEEKQRILDTPVFTDGKPFQNTYYNRVFLLTAEQVLQLFPTEASRRALPTPYALKQGAGTGREENTKEYVSWWILPRMEITGGTPPRWDYPQAVFPDGMIRFHSRNIARLDFTVRPAIRIAR